MSLADHIFIDMCNDILTNGTSTEGEKVRPHWPDGTHACTEIGIWQIYNNKINQ